MDTIREEYMMRSQFCRTYAHLENSSKGGLGVFSSCFGLRSAKPAGSVAAGIREICVACGGYAKFWSGRWSQQSQECCICTRAVGAANLRHVTSRKMFESVDVADDHQPSAPKSSSSGRTLHMNAPVSSRQHDQQIREELGHLLFDHPLVPEKLHSVHHDFEPSIRSRRETVKDFTLNLIEIQADDLTANIDEGYTLRLAIEDGEWRIMCTATSFSGVYYALQTLRQLFYKHSQSTQLELYSPFVPAIVRDKPRFVHRGLNVDIARNRMMIRL
nr:beta-hexosaminidase [Quercus suber]